MILESVIVKCPVCELKSIHQLAVSGTILESVAYTDGKMLVISGMYSENPYLIKCRKCGGYYFFEDHYTRGSEPDNADSNQTYEFLEHREYYHGPQDYKEAILQLGELSKDNELLLRTKYWWAINDLIRVDVDWKHKKSFLLKALNIVFSPLIKMKRFHPRYSEYKRWLMDKNENLLKIQSMLNPEKYQEEWLTMIEIYRELSQFKKADEALEKSPLDNNQKYLKLQKHLIAKKDFYVRLIK